jgi:hypothetical protein
MRQTTLALVIACASCSPSRSGDDSDGATDAVVQNPLAELDTETISPADGTIVGPGDNPLEVSIEAPSIIPGFSGTVPSSVDVRCVAGGDAATPADAADDWSDEVFHHVDVPLGTLTTGTLDLDAVNGGSGAAGGESITLRFTATSVRPAGTFTREAAVTFHYHFP